MTVAEAIVLARYRAAGYRAQAQAHGLEWDENNELTPRAQAFYAKAEVLEDFADELESREREPPIALTGGEAVSEGRTPEEGND